MATARPIEDQEESAVCALLRATSFAAAAHSRTRRKGAAQEPYIEHLIEVTEILADCGGARDSVLLQAAMLHDTLEDTPVTEAELAAAFGAPVATVVAEMTDDTTLPKEERKRLQVETASTRSERARQIKVADKISNLRGLVVSPPAHWEFERKIAYFAWAEAVVAGCRGVNPALDGLFDDTCAQGRAVLDAQRRLAPGRR